MAIVIIGVIGTLVYMIMGIGVSRAIAKMKDRDVSLPKVCLWPFAILIIAATGDIA